MYQGGRGRMLIKAASLVTVADAGGAEMDQGSMMRSAGTGADVNANSANMACLAAQM
jgi:Family of unknown function (DUF6544)